MIKIPVIHLSFKLEKPLVIPVNYQHALQSFVYHILPNDEADFLHNHGFQYHNRSFKFFSFSRLYGSSPSYDPDAKTLTFQNKIALSISSVLPNLLEKTANNLLLSEKIHFHGQALNLDSLKYEEYKIDSDKIIVKAISPITVYSTFERRGGKKLTHYYHPNDEIFRYLVEENFIKKYETFTGRPFANETTIITIEPIRVMKSDKVVTNYKGTWITGYTGVYKLQAKPEHLSFALNCGLGAKNSIGFGMVTPLRDEY